MDTKLLDGSMNPYNIVRVVQHNQAFYAEHPDYFRPEGLLIFCGAQGSGKTLSAVQYVKKLCEEYPNAILCTNVEIHGLNPDTVVVEYDGLDCLKNLENGYRGVIFFIDEIHLEFNSLESKNIDIEVIIEISQQRKQRKHIIGTTQVYGRMAKPLREQIKNVVLCNCICRVFQINTLIDGAKSYEKDGKLVTDTVKRFYWFHRPELYDSYDTYAKMRRYKNEWKGRPMNARSN